MENKGVQLAADPDLRVHYHIIIDNKSAVQPAAYGYNYSNYWMRNQVDVFQYREGTLIIDLMDSKNKNLIWRGWGVSVLNDNNVSLTEEEISDAVIKILKELPPTKWKQLTLILIELYLRQGYFHKHRSLCVK